MNMLTWKMLKEMSTLLHFQVEFLCLHRVLMLFPRTHPSTPIFSLHDQHTLFLFFFEEMFNACIIDKDVLLEHVDASMTILCLHKESVIVYNNLEFKNFFT